MPPTPSPQKGQSQQPPARPAGPPPEAREPGRPEQHQPEQHQGEQHQGDAAAAVQNWWQAFLAALIALLESLQQSSDCPCPEELGQLVRHLKSRPRTRALLARPPE